MSAPTSVAGLKVAVLGLGKSGVAAARLALARGAASVYASDLATGPALERASVDLRERGAEVELGRHDPARLAAADLAVLSPGIPAGDTPLARLPGLRTVGELELASWYVKASIAAVTGTNGKTTTTALLQAICERADVASVAAGNIGLPLSEVALSSPSLAWVVCEVSSFQLASTETFRPRVAVLTNLAPDHLDRYAAFSDYAADKERMARNMTADDALILNADDRGSRDFARSSEAARWFFTVREPAAPGLGVVSGRMTERSIGGGLRDVADVATLRLRGPHNLQNALAAALAALRMGIGTRAVAEGLATFPGVPHRLEEVAEIEGVLFVNDSKATNVDATRWALRSFTRPMHLILGGRHKGSPYAPLLEEMAGKVKQVLALGEARGRIVAELGGGVPVRPVDSLDEAVTTAYGDAAPGDVVLLSPACSSYDMFRDFEDRGEAFRRSVRSLAAASGAGRAARREPT